MGHKSRNNEAFWGRVRYIPCYGQGMTNSFDGAWGGPFDSENDDTIEMVLSDSAMQLLSQAAAAVESARPIANPVVKEAGVQVGGGVKPVARSAGETKLAARMPGIPQGRPVVDVLIVGEAKPTTDSRVVPQPPPDRRPPMSRLRFAVILSLVAVGSAILTAVTYSVLTGPRPAGSAETNVSAPAVPRTAASMVPPGVGGIASTSAGGGLASLSDPIASRTRCTGGVINRARADSPVRKSLRQKRSI